MAEYIEREASCKDCIHYDVCYHIEHYGRETETDKPCKKFKSDDVVEVVHGEWTNIRDYGDYCLGHCSVCWAPQEAAFPSALKEGFRYCRWCGAKMDGDVDEGKIET